MVPDLSRLLAPRRIAVIGGGVWCANVITQCRRFPGATDLVAVHPSKSEVAGCPAVRDIAALPWPPDAAFVGVNREASVTVVRALAERGAGGAVCFASGFAEAGAEMAGAADLERDLLRAAGAMPILGPNCYGFLNYLDGAGLWPDEHGGAPVSSGVAIITQSSNMAINLTMQNRGLPLAYVVTAGNQAQLDQAAIGQALLADDRVTALGLHVEGIRDPAALFDLARAAAALGKPIIALKVGSSEEARIASLSHTASLAGSADGASALFARLGIGEVRTLTEFLETLKMLHWYGPLPEASLTSASCSGGEASLMADTGLRHGVRVPPLDHATRAALREALGPRVALSNPLDYHTYIWGDVERMAGVFAAIADAAPGLACVIADFPDPARCDGTAWDCVIAAVARVAATGRRIALVATLPEGLPDGVRQRAEGAGVATFRCLDDLAVAIRTAARCGTPHTIPPVAPRPPDRPAPMTEAKAKADLAAHGLAVPRARRAEGRIALAAALREVGLPAVIKAEGLVHKTERGGVVFATESPLSAMSAATSMPCDSWLVEERIEGTVVELLVGVTCDPAHGYLLTLGAGGIESELRRDTTHLLLPVTGADIQAALDRLALAPLLDGYRGRPAADRGAIAQAVLAVQTYVMARIGRLAEVEINPLICTPDRAVAVDALITLGETE